MKALRLKAGLKVEEVANCLKVSVSTVHNWDQGNTSPRMTASKFQKLLHLYKCTLDDLIQAESKVTAKK